MRVLYDYAAFGLQLFGGVSKCFCELIAHRPPGEDYAIGIKQSNNVHLIEESLVAGLKPACCDRVAFTKRFGKGFISRKTYAVLSRLPFSPVSERVNKEYSISLIKAGNYDVLHATSITGEYFLKYLGDKPFVYTVHDMIQERFPQYFGSPCKTTAFKQLLCNRAAAVIVVSEQTKRDLMEILGVPEEKISIVYHGGPAHVEVKEDPIVDGQYFLFVGQRWTYKNFLKTLEDFSLFARQHEGVRLVCTANAFTDAERERIAALGLTDRVVHKCVSESGLKNLYTYALAFIYPSLYEGFGMPTLEAFAQGCPCLLNDNSCFREVGGDAAFYFKSDGVKSNLQEVMERVYNLTAEERAALVQAGYEQLAKFSWVESAKKLWDVYYKVIKDMQHADNKRIIKGGGKWLEYSIGRTLGAHVKPQNVAA